MPPSHRFFICPDAEMIAAQVARELSGAGDGLERKVFWADDDPPLPDAFWQDLTQIGLFSTPKALIVRRANTLKAEHWTKLEKPLASVPSSITVIFCMEAEWTKKTPPIPAWLKKRNVYAEADKAGRTWASPGLTQKDLGGFVNDWAKAEGLSFAPGGREALMAALPLDARKARLELDKIALAATDGKVTPQHAELLVESDELDFFAFMDALSTGQTPEKVWKRVLDNHLESDNMVFNLVGYLSWEARTLWMLSHGEERSVRVPPFVRNKKNRPGQTTGRRQAVRPDRPVPGGRDGHQDRRARPGAGA